MVILPLTVLNQPEMLRLHHSPGKKMKKGLSWATVPGALNSIRKQVISINVLSRWHCGAAGIFLVGSCGRAHQQGGPL